MLFSEIWFFISAVGTWKTLTLLLLLTALKNETESVIIDFSLTTRLPAKRVTVPPMLSTVPLLWLAAKKFQSIWMSVSAYVPMYQFLNWLDGLSDTIWAVLKLSINKLWRIFLTKSTIHCLEWETSFDTTTARWHSFFCHKAAVNIVIWVFTQCVDWTSSW